MATSNGVQQGSCTDFATNWQAGKTLAECNLRMLNNEDSCDVSFRCGAEGLVIKAHRYVLMSRSCEFHAMFSGSFTETHDVSIPDTDPSIFKTFLVYLYTDDTTVDIDNATALLYTAQQYCVTGLEKKCLDVLNQNLTAENACNILEASHNLGQAELFKKALTLIYDEGERSLKSPGFLTLNQVLVDQVLQSDDLVADEHVVFTALSNWAEAECSRQEREVTPESKRSVLGETLHRVRFPIMRQKSLVESVKPSGLLTDAERLMIQDYVITLKGNTDPYSNNMRRSPAKAAIRSVSKRRFPTKSALPWKVGNLVDAISFQSNKNLMIHGCQLYNKYQSNGGSEYKVTTYFGNDVSVLNNTVQDDEIFTVEGEVFDVIFSQSIKITAGLWYTLAVKLVGPVTWRGEWGLENVVGIDGVQLTFKDSSKSSNDTRVSHGQIPSLIYSILK